MKIIQDNSVDNIVTGPTPVECPKCGSDNVSQDRKFQNEYHCDNGCNYWFIKNEE